MTGGRAAAVALAGAALSLAFPEPGLWPLAWICPAVLVWAAAGRRLGQGAALGFIFGLCFFGSLLWWISLVGFLAWAVLVAVQAIFLGGFGLTWAVASRGLGRWTRPLAAGALWAAWELVRARIPVGGFTWGQLAQAQTDASWLLPAAGLGGGWLLGLLAVVAGSLLAEAAAVVPAWRRAGALLAAAAAVVAWPAALTTPRPDGREISVAIVQGNVPRDFTGGPYAKQLEILRSHAGLTASLAGEGVDLVVWPESAVGLDYRSNPQVERALREAARAVGAPMLVGANLDAPGGRYRVVILYVSASGEVVDVYRKTHLVPFGEYVPARGLIGWIPALRQVPRDAIASDEHAVFEVAGGRVAPVISFEGDFGSLVRRPVAAGGRLVVVATNTSTWGETWASAQHLAFSRLRAAENGVWVVHAALNGISGFVTPDGEVVARAPLWTRRVLRADVRFARDVTVYVRLGDWLPWLCAAVSALLVGRGLLATARAARARQSRSPVGVRAGDG